MSRAVRKPEILAPAGSYGAVVAAINAGADAVYLGATAFNARIGAKGFGPGELERAIALCAAQEVAVYLTLNTLVKDEEFPQLVELLNHLSSQPLSGLIVQDPGLIYFLQKYYPNLPLQTSTQMTVTGLYGVRFFENQGFSRVVLPREMGLEEIARIRRDTKVELKAFAHGALCYCYSGACLMSSLIGGRSGNRGLCAGPCRKPYSLVDRRGEVVKKGYLISPKDLNTLAHMEEIKAAGIDSLKIEGRLKDPAYVYAVTTAYREARDGVKATVSEEELAQVFNRGFTAGCLFGEKEIIEDRLGRNQGRPVGKVTACAKGKLTVKPAGGRAVAQGDGLALGLGGRGFTVGKKPQSNRGSVVIDLPPGLSASPGTTVYKTYDAALMERLSAAATKGVELPKDEISMAVTIRRDRPVRVTTTVSGESQSYQSEITPQAAQKRPLSPEIVTEQLSKLGDTPYILGELTVELDDGLFLTKGELNQLRREVVASLNAPAVPAAKTVDPAVLNEEWSPKEAKCKPGTPIISVEVRDETMLAEVIASQPDEIVYEIEPEALVRAETRERIADHCSEIKDGGAALALRFPRIIDTRSGELLADHLAFIAGLHPDGLLLSSYETIEIFKDIHLPKEADWTLQIMNALAAKWFSGLGFAGGVLSPELKGGELRGLLKRTELPLTLGVYGRQEAMISAVCVLNCEEKNCDDCRRRGHYTLVDERGEDFPVYLDGRGYTHIYNGHVLRLGTELLSLVGLAKWRLYPDGDDRGKVADLVAVYRSLAAGKKVGQESSSKLKYTKGHYKRGVL